MDYSLQLSKMMAQRGSYFESTLELDSSTSNSPDNANELMHRYGAANAGIFSPNEMWNTVDLDVFGGFEDIKQAPKKGVSMSPSEGSEGHLPASKMRRRAQNRASQRAFRERKEKHVKGLEFQLEILNEKHQDLQQSYNKQTDNINKLKQRISQLQAALKVMRNSSTSSSSPPPPPSSSAVADHSSHHHRHHYHGPSSLTHPATFDAFSFPPAPTSMMYDGNEMGFSASQSAMDETTPRPSSTTNETKNLPLFEDLLPPLT